jgi:hypothetical protein
MALIPVSMKHARCTYVSVGIAASHIAHNALQTVSYKLFKNRGVIIEWNCDYTVQVRSYSTHETGKLKCYVWSHGNWRWHYVNTKVYLEAVDQHVHIMLPCHIMEQLHYKL